VTDQLISLEDAAQWLGVSIRHIQVMCEEGMPHEGLSNKRFIRWPEARHWRDKRIEAKVKKSLKAGGAEESKDRKLAAEAEMAEIALAERRGELVTVAAVEQSFANVFARLRSKILNLPQAGGMRVVGETLQERTAQMQAIADELLRDLQEDPNLTEAHDVIPE
jgi:hypothetical protein